MVSRQRSTAVRSVLAAMLVLALACVAALLVTTHKARADASPSPSASQTHKPIVLNSGWTEQVDNLNPFIGLTLVSYHIFWENYDRLVRYDPVTLKPVPGIAESWETSADAKTWTFHIRHGVKWQDGVDLTAKDVAFTFNYVIKNNMGSFTVYTNHIASVTATDDYTVVFKCSEPRGTLLQMWVPILPEHIWSKISPKDAKEKFANPAPIIGSGPFQVVEWKKGNYVRMVANKNYWGGAPKIDEMVLHFYTNPDTLTADLDLGVIDMSNQVPPAQFKKYQSKPGFTAQRAAHDRLEVLSMNCYQSPSSLGNPVLRDPKFRKALAWAIDNPKIVSLAYTGLANVGSSLLPSDFWKAPNDYHWPVPADQLVTYNPEKAKQLLDEAGYKDTNGDGIHNYKGKPIKLRLWADSSMAVQNVTGKLMIDWFTAIGLKIQFSTLEYSAINAGWYNYVNGKFAPDWDMALSYWGGDYDPGFILGAYTTAQIENWNGDNWSNAEYDDLYKQQDATLDPAARLKMIYRMQEIVYAECPDIVFAYPQDTDVYNTQKWDGWVKMPGGNGSVANLWSYINVHPKAGATTAAKGSNTGLLIGIVVAVIVVAGIVVIVMRRRRATRAVEE